MSESLPFSVIAVDGGGSSCRFGLSHRGQRHELRLGAANVTSDAAAARLVVITGLEALAERAGLSFSELITFPAYLGLAGALGGAETRAFAKALPLTDFRIEEDWRPALAGAIGMQDGAVIGVGTGSFLAHQKAGIARSLGGWGLVLGDEASGAYLGRGLLAQILRAEDGIVAHTDLTRSILLRDFNNLSGEVVAFSQGANAQEFGRYAPEIADAAEAEDAIASALMQAGADYLVQGLKALGWREGEALGAHGSVALRYRHWLPPQIASALPAAPGNALDGAFVLATAFAREGRPR